MLKGAPARIDARSSARVNHEIYFFATPSSVRSFRRNPLKYCGEVTDPVSLERFRPKKKSPRMDWDDRPYFFASDSTLTVFRDDPEMYAERPAGMVPKPEGDEANEGAAGGEPMDATKDGAGDETNAAEPRGTADGGDAPEHDGAPDGEDPRSAAFIGPLLPPAPGDDC
ncbi:MAG TPA: hypothetical protein VKU85_20450 [bacterium]|nr:hypothetical protein [bacterium]